ncbi:MAG TPA: arginase [Gemmatimonas sp.]|nr:arginase [Gemmatimonas sp.]
MSIPPMQSPSASLPLDSTQERAVAGVGLPKRVRLIGVPLDLGAARRGVDMGPSALRIAELASTLERLGHIVSDDGNLAVPQRETLTAGGELGAITEICRELANRTAAAIRAGEFPIVLGGDHSLAAGSVAGAASAMADGGERLGVIWLDAHSDLNTPATTVSGNVHGMPAAHLLGEGHVALASIASRPPAVLPEHLVYIGLRDLDPPERALIHRRAIKAYTMRDIDERGLTAIMREAITVASAGTGGLYLSCDADWVDPSEAPGVGTPVPGGATFREAHLAMEMLADSGRLIGMDFVEINPVLDRMNSSARLGVQLIASALGKRTL